jgi:hypothetical protein
LKTFQVTHGLLVNGFDLINDARDGGVARDIFRFGEPVMKSWGLELLMITSNLKQIRDSIFHKKREECTWSSVLIANAHALGNLFGRYLFPSGGLYTWAGLIPHGSHPVLDPRLSSDQLQIIHTGAEATRAKKLETIIDVLEAQQNLRVCFAGPYFDPETGRPLNCGKCEKCIRTIPLLDMLGRLEAFSSFSNHLPIDHYKRPDFLGRSKKMYMEENYELAIRCNRQDWVRAYQVAAEYVKRQEAQQLQ